MSIYQKKYFKKDKLPTEKNICNICICQKKAHKKLVSRI